jgi:tRNA A-37 threonylcarbamoyl transferase component Bud32
MPPPATVPEFLDLVRRSGVTDGGRLTAYLDRLAVDGLPPTPARAADLLIRDGFLTNFQAEQILLGKWKRFTLGKYKVLERLGSGGMAHVFLCEHTLMRRRVAVKVLPAAKAADKASLNRFYREARAVAALDHPNIVRAYDIDQDDHLHFLVMEYVDGTNLQELVKKFGPLDVDRACHYVAQAAVGLQHAHENGLVHRDVKPGNLLLDRAGSVKVLDLGLARFFHDADDHLTKQYDDAILGTADYLSPEQAEDSHAVDIRTDVYSLGATLYYLLTGKPPFPDGTIPQKLIWLRNRQPAPVRELRPEVPEELAGVVARMMAKDPADRYQTPAEVADALARWTAAPIPPPPDREMPKLSPAAAGTAGAGVTGRSGAVTLTGGGTGARPPLPPDGGGAGGSDATVWAALDLAEAPTTVAGRTSLALAGGGPPAPADARPGRAGRRVVVAVASGVAVLAGLAVGGYYLLAPPKPRAVPPAAPAGPRRLTVSKAHPGGENTFGTLAAALKAAGPGDTVVLADDRLTEPELRLDRRTKDLTIESGLPGGRAAVIEFNTAGGPGPLEMLAVANADGLRIRNVEFDGKGVAHTGVQVAGLAPGAVFDGVTVRGVKEAGFRLVNAAGDTGRPIVLDRCRVVLSPATEAGVLVQSTGTLDSKRIVVRNGRFEGPGKAGVRLDGPVADAEVTGNRFYKLSAAVVIGRAAGGRAVRAQVAHNTVYEADAGVLFGPTPGGGPGAGAVGVNQNYFARTKAVGRADGDPPGWVAAAGNASDAESKPGNVPIGGGPDPALQLRSVDPTDDAAFLRFPPGAPGTAGAR